MSLEDPPSASELLPERDRAYGKQLSVGVLVDLFLGPAGGGHVHAWTELARAARNEDLDLTVYFLSNEAKTVNLAPNVRFVLTRPLVSTAST